MSALARPGVLAALLVAAAALVHPATRSATWLPGREPVLAALALLIVVGLLARAIAAPRRWSTVLVATGAAVLVGAVAGDGLRGLRGTLALVPGQSRTHFDEVAPDGRSLGLRPLGFPLALDDVRPDGAAILAIPGETAILTADAAVSLGGLRFSRPRAVATGSASRLRVSVSGGGTDEIAELGPGRPARVGDLTLTLEEYFPDFALDEQRQPFTRSLEPMNPAALLSVDSPRGRFRVFVLQSMPGVHRVEALDRSFALRGVEPEASVEIAVRREPLALGVLLGGLVMLAGVALGGRAR
jgi:hypothetical protein